jgi:hypothetical protein
MKRVFVMACLVACGGASGPPKLASKNAVDITLVGPKIDATFDAKSARFEEATAQLHAIVGHPIAFELDTAIFSESKDKLEDMVLGDIELVAADLAKLKKSAPAAFVHGAPLVETVRLRYDATYDARELDAKLDPKAHALVITGKGGGWNVTPGVVAQALVHELEDYAFRHFGTAEPEDIAPGERAAYFVFITDWHKRQKWLADHPKPATPKVPRNPDVELVRKVAKLATLVHEEPAATEIKKWLFERLTDWSYAYRGSDLDAANALPETHEWHVAERAYSAWLGAQIATTTDEERTTMSRYVFAPHAFPGFDRIAFGFAVIDDWIKNGHANKPIVTAIVCPVEAKDAKPHEPVQRCDRTFYRWALENDMPHFADALVARNDAKLVEAAVASFAAINHADRTNAILAIARALQKNEPLWRTAVITAADESAQLDVPALVAELSRAWTDLPERRGTILYALAWIDRAVPRTIAWDKLSPPATAGDLAAALDQPRPMQVIHRVWPALGKGWSRTQTLAPFLGRFVDAERAPGEADETIRGIAHAMCEEKATTDIRDLVAFFDKRRAEHPAERYSKVVTESATCRH